MRCEGVALPIDDRSHLQLALVSVETDHFPEPVAEVMAARLRCVVELVSARIHAARGDLVELRLPQMRPRTIQQLHLRIAALSETVAQTCCELETGCPAANDENSMH